MKGYYRRLRKYTLKVGDDTELYMKDKIVFAKNLSDDTIEIWSFGERHENPTIIEGEKE